MKPEELQFTSNFIWDSTDDGLRDDHVRGKYRFLSRCIEKYGTGTGTLVAIRSSADLGLPEPGFEQRGGEFVVTLWRPLLIDLAQTGNPEIVRSVLRTLCGAIFYKRG